MDRKSNAGSSNTRDRAETEARKQEQKTNEQDNQVILNTDGTYTFSTDNDKWQKRLGWTNFCRNGGAEGEGKLKLRDARGKCNAAWYESISVNPPTGHQWNRKKIKGLLDTGAATRSEME